MLAHASSQKLTQLRLETYLSSMNTPDLNIASHLERSHNKQRHTNGTSTPQDLSSRLKILEIYALHVLPRNQEYAYARDFIIMNEALDEERKEAFIQALQSVQDEREFNFKKEAELQRQREQQAEGSPNRVRETQKAAQTRSKCQTKNRKETFESQANSENYIKPGSKPEAFKRQTTKLPINASAAHSISARGSTGVNSDRGESNRNGARRPPARLPRKFALFLSAMQRGILSMAQSLRAHPLMLVRMLAFLTAFFMALNRRDLRDQLLGAGSKSWTKLKQTVGMGTKVSYI